MKCNIVWAWQLLFGLIRLFPVRAFFGYPVTSFITKSAFRLGETAVKTEGNLLSDQLEGAKVGVNIATFSAQHFVFPVVTSVASRAGRTIYNVTIAAYRKAREKFTRWRELRKIHQFVQEGPGSVLSILAWLNANMEILRKHPIDAISILDSTLRHKHYDLLDLLISKIALALEPSPAARRLYAALFVRSDLPVRYLKDAVGENPLSAVGHIWWVHHFMSRIVVFPPDAFRDFIALFFEAFPTSEQNNILQLLKIPRDNKSINLLPEHVQRQIDILDQLSLYYILKEPHKAHQLRTNYRPKNLMRNLKSLEFFLGISGFMDTVALNPTSHLVFSTARWILDTFVKNQEADHVIKTDSYRVLKVLLAANLPPFSHTDLAKLCKSSITNCAPQTYSVLIQQSVRLPKRPPKGTCSRIRYVHNVQSSTINQRVNQKCADIVLELDQMVLDRSKIQPLEEMSKYSTILAAGIVLEQVFGIDRDAHHIASFLKNGSIRKVSRVVNNVIAEHCHLQHLQPNVRVAYSKENRYRPSEIVLGKTLAHVIKDSGNLSTSRIKAEEIKNVLLKLITTDNLMDFKIQFSRSMEKGQLDFDDCKRLIGFAMLKERLGIFDLLVKETIGTFLESNRRDITEMLKRIQNVSSKFRKRTSRYNYQTLSDNK